MNRADLLLKEDIESILMFGYKDENPRPKYKDGTPAHTYSVNHVVRKYNLQEEFPITTLRPIAWKSAIKEILWIYQDQSNSLDLLENKYNVKWWRDWEIESVPGTIGCRYGETVRKYDLLNRLINDIKTNPYGRRKVMDLWQENDFEESEGLNPCAFLTVWNVRGKYLDMCLFQRSGDMLTASGAGGVNEVQYAALQIMIARHTGYKPGMFTHIVANEQIYDRHLENANILLDRESSDKVPRLVLNPNKSNFYDFTIEDFELVDYFPCKGEKLIFELGI